MIRVRLADIIEGMEVQSDEMIAYLHRPAARVVIVSEEAFTAAQEDDEHWVEPEELNEARKILTNQKDYVALPDRFEIDEYRMMQRFATGIPNTREQDELLAVLHGAGAFRRFKDAVQRLSLAEAWYAFRNRSYEEVAREWCEANNIAIASEAEQPGR